MAKPRLMTEHTLDAHKGWPNPHAVDFAAKLSANVTIDPVFAGRCVHVNNSGEFEMGVALRQMALFLFQNSDDPDVLNDGGDAATDPNNWVAIAPTGVMMALVAAGAFELRSTEFDTTKTYLVNDTLTAGSSNTDTATGGVITNASAVAYTDAVCGVVSRLPGQNAHRQQEISFWPVYLPATP